MSADRDGARVGVRKILQQRSALRNLRSGAKRTAAILATSSVVLLCGAAYAADLHSGSSSRSKSAGDGHPELRLCTQNLQRFGSDRPARKGSREPSKLDALVERFIEARCDIVAVQEVAGKNKLSAESNLKSLAARLSERSKRRFRTEIGDSRDPSIRNGFIISEQFGAPDEVISYDDEQIPSLTRRRPGGYFVRAPLGLVLTIAPVMRGGATAIEGAEKKFFILNVHSKSRHGGEKDPTGTDFETLRMEYAEATRLIVRREIARLGGETVAVVLGDHNSHERSASAEILSGTLQLSDFQAEGQCRLDDELEPDCKTASQHPPELVGLFELRRDRAPTRYRGGSFRYRGKESLIDEISISPNALPLVTGESGNLRVAFNGTIGQGSDHRLLVAEFDY